VCTLNVDQWFRINPSTSFVQDQSVHIFRVVYDSHTPGLRGGLEHLKTETRLRGETLGSVKGECDLEARDAPLLRER
jgi:hypothetical protein